MSLPDEDNEKMELLFKKLSEAENLVNEIYKDRLGTVLATLHDYEPKLNLLQLYLQTCLINYFVADSREELIKSNMVITQAIFLLGYDAARSEQKMENLIPSWIRNMEANQ